MHESQMKQESAKNLERRVKELEESEKRAVSEL
jgi:hypothetical protein